MGGVACQSKGDIVCFNKEPKGRVLNNNLKNNGKVKFRVHEADED